MSYIDWLVLVLTLSSIILYGLWKSRGQKNIQGYLLGDQSLPWYHVMFSVMATQASAITFLSAPGQAFTDGMRFVQYYFGLPLAMIVICIVFLPLFHRLKVYTAYEYLENRFDVKTRALTAFLFLIQRGLAAGLTIYAPALILSSLLGWNIYLTNMLMGGLVIFYTVVGGTKAVSYTQLQQMSVILIGMFIAGFLIVQLLPHDIGFSEALSIAGESGKMNVITTEFDLDDKYNIWSGLIGGFFLALAYFGTDQSQVGRYLSGKSITESRTGLLLTGMIKIPIQFFILLIGIMLFSFYQFHDRPVFFNPVAIEKVKNSEYVEEFNQLQNNYNLLNEKNGNDYRLIVQTSSEKADILEARRNIEAREYEMKKIRNSAVELIKKADPAADTNDTNYIFLNFVIHYLPIGIIGLLIAVIFSASWSSTASELNALASTTIVDFYKRFSKRESSEKHFLIASKWSTVIWGGFAILVAMFANQLGSLIEAVNILGSLFYGTILGIFLTAFFLKQVQGNAVFIAALITETTVICFYLFDATAFLWLNLIGCVLVMLLSVLFQMIPSEKNN